MEYNYNYKKLGLIERLKCFFISPLKLFEEVRKVNSNEIHMMILLTCSAIIAVINNNLLLKTLGDEAKDLIGNSTFMNINVRDVLSDLAFSPFIAVLNGIITTGVYVLAVALILNILLKFLSKKVEYVDVLNVVSIAYLAQVVGMLFKTLFMTLVNKPVFLMFDPTSNFLVKLLHYVDPFHIWYLVLLVFGFSIVNNISRKKSAVLVFGLWAASMLFIIIFS